MAQLAASTVEQTAQLRASQATTANQLVAELCSCPIPSQPVYGNQPIFTCPQTVATNNCGCGCRRIYTTNYEVEVHANIEIPTGGTVEKIQLAIAVDGVIDPASIMSFTPAAVEVAGNVGTSIIVSVPSICGCDSVAVVNASTQPITVNNASLVFDYAGVQRLR